MLYHCDALLPVAERYSSTKFRRLSRRFYAHRLDAGDRLELASFLAVVPVRWSKWIFHWDRIGLWQAKLIPPAPQDFANANFGSVTLEDGLAVLQAMKDGGWTYGGLPWIVRMSILGLRDAKMTHKEIAELTGLTDSRVYDAITHGRRRRPAITKRDRALAGVLVG
jgi:hypothetical protein